MHVLYQCGRSCKTLALVRFYAMHFFFRSFHLRTLKEEFTREDNLKAFFFISRTNKANFTCIFGAEVIKKTHEKGLSTIAD